MGVHTPLSMNAAASVFDCFNRSPSRDKRREKGLRIFLGFFPRSTSLSRAPSCNLHPPLPIHTIPHPSHAAPLDRSPLDLNS
jgi:hypothetical protein